MIESLPCYYSAKWEIATKWNTNMYKGASATLLCEQKRVKNTSLIHLDSY